MSSPFDGMFEDIFRLVGQQGPDAWWQTAQQLAHNVANADEDSSANVDPLLRQRLDDVVDLVGRRVDEFVGGGASGPIEAINRQGLVTRCLDEWHPLISVDAVSPALPDDLGGNDMLRGLLTTMGPLFVGFQVGSAIGHFTADAASCGDLPLPRAPEGSAHLHLAAIARMAARHSLSVDTVIIYFAAREFLSRWLLADSGLSLSLRALLADATRDALAAQGDVITRLTDSLRGGDMSALANPEELLAGLNLPDSTPAMDRVSAVGEILRATLTHCALAVTESIVGPATDLRDAWAGAVQSEQESRAAAAALFGLSLEIRASAQDFAVVVRDLGADGLVALRRADGAPLADECTDVAAWWQRVSNSPLA